ncbi:sulfotransferase family 2 domain-containing protein [Aquisalimonas lutea]|uniref:sulfotransferase family 2 domain-containing protein n=1 Tax=Aquisalimonas lutea TaxID=1327750 RepID=UPI0025B2FCF0|nr:sulfotransferase family 2 domain-containing protein [Aquisalimonas lutea]MDN3517871.1 sulfotransferase family 2 domain-containing protein [Aquisalimonas lutea]
MAIVCHKHKFMFIKTRKTAGSSVEIALSRLCDADDFVTPLSYPDGFDERLRRESGGQSPVNWRKRWWQYRDWKEIRHRIKYGKQAMVLGTHATARELRNRYGDATWNQYLRVTIERNPWDKAVSRYWWMKHRHERRHSTPFEPMSAFFHRVAEQRPHWLSNWHHYTINDQLAVDVVLFYETLQDDLYALARRLRVSEETLQLPQKRAKSGFRRDDRPYTEVLSPQDRDLITDVCRKEIELFGYRFEAGENHDTATTH